MFKAILINVKEKTITEVEIAEEGIADIYKHLGCGCFDVVGIGEDSSCYIDDEGLVKDAYIDKDGTKHNMHGFSINKGVILIGNGLVLGCNPEDGDNADSPLTIEQVTELVTFVEYDAPEDRPEPFIQVTAWDI